MYTYLPYRMSMFTTVIILIIVALHEVKTSSQGKPLQSTLAKRAILSSDQITCIVDNVATRLDGPSNTTCRSVASQLGQLYNSIDVAQSISGGLNNFPEFCRVACGQVLIDIWQDCNAFDDIEDVANLLIGMCASDMGVTCYSNFDELFQYVDDGENCYNNLINTGICSSDCSTTLADGVQQYGCCVNVPIDFQDVREEASSLLSACDVNLPARCTNSPLSAASHTVGVAVNIIIIAVLAAWQLI